MRNLAAACALLAFACTKESAKSAEAPSGGVAPPSEAPAPPAEAPPKPKAMEIAISSRSPEALEQFMLGRDRLDNARLVESVPYFKKALALDPSFALAQSYLGLVTTGPEGLTEIERAAALAAKLPEAERTLIELTLADRRGEVATGDELTKKLLRLTPEDWHVRFMAGGRAFNRRDYRAASSELEKAAELNPKVGSIYNLLGYAALFQGNKDQAIVALKKYAELSPTEPNPHDSLGDALLASGKLEEAEASYSKALAVAPAFFFSWTGVAESRALRGDWRGAQEALGKGQAAAERADDKVQLGMWIAFFQLAAHKPKDALKTMDDAEKAALKSKADLAAAIAAVTRAALVLEAGRPQEVTKLVTAALDRAAKANLPGAGLRFVRSFGLHVQVLALAKLGREKEAEKTAAAFDEEVKNDPENRLLVSAQHDVHGLVAVAGKATKVAAEQFSQCLDEDPLCSLHRIEALEQLGDKAGAETVRQSLTATPRRDEIYVWVRAKLGTIPSRTAAN